MSKVLIVNSSYRPKSNSSLLSHQIALGAQSKGHDVEEIDIAKMDIKACRGCGGCMGPTAKLCVIKDDMTALYPKVIKADVIIYASPIYWFTMGGQIKQFIDRCFAVARLESSDGKHVFANKKLGAALSYGDDDVFAAGGVNAIRTLQDTSSYTGSTWLGAIYGSAMEAGEIAKNEALMAKAFAFGEKI